MKFGMHFLE